MATYSHSNENKQSSSTKGTRNNLAHRNVGDRAFHSSAHIMQLQRTMGNKAVLHMMKSYTDTQQAPIQRQVTYEDKKGDVIPFPNTWKQLMRAMNAMPDQIKELTESLITQINDSIDGEINQRTLETAWSRVVKDKKQVFDLKTQSNEIIEFFQKKYVRSSNAKEKYGIRSGDAKKIAEELVNEDSSLKFKGGARNPMVTSKKLEEFSYDSKTSKQAQIQTQIA